MRRKFRMNIKVITWGLMLGMAGPLVGQSAQQKADQDLVLAQIEMKKLQEGILEEESSLVVQVERLDEEVVELSKELAKLLGEEESMAGRQKKLDDELAGRKGEFEFTLSSLRSYSRGLVNRLNGAEMQSVKEELEAGEQAAQAAGEDLSGEVSARVGSIGVGAERLKKISGGSIFEGKAVGPGSVVKEGTFALIGPVSYFAAADQSVAGITTFGGADMEFPGMVVVPAEAGGGAIAALTGTGAATVPADASMGKALQVARSKKSMVEYLEGGGVVGFGILLLGAVALLIAVFKFIEIQHFPVPKRKEINLILDDLLEDRVPSAKEKADAISDLSGELVRAGVKYFFDKRRILEDALMEKLSFIQPRLDRFLSFLALAAAAAPMMGLLGTVLGIMKTFAMMSAVGTGDSRAFSAGISEALITTAEGLVVAIPVIIIHGMLKSLAKAKFGQVEGVALSLLNGTTELGSKPTVSTDKNDEEEEDDLEERELAPA
ncbi:MAG: MotA/TolQ/ExbB proton channel family protein [Verrucomicrobia bacterium]|nr:MotA/TolQ/ExbB proton channel family protein [Verrucomicrobiota bacterium]